MYNDLLCALTRYTTYVQRTGGSGAHEMIIDVRGQTVLLIHLIHFERQLLVVVHSLDPMPSIVADRIRTGKSLLHVKRIIVAQIARHDHFAVVKLQRQGGRAARCANREQHAGQFRRSEFQLKLEYSTQLEIIF